MANVIINDSNLTNIAAAIREKNGTTTTYKPSEMASAIAAIETGGGGEGLPEEAFTFTGNCSYKFTGGSWDWFVEDYGDKITTSNITNGDNMFFQSNLEEIPFDIDFDNTTYRSATGMFHTCKNLKSIGRITDFYPSMMKDMFNNCQSLRYLPDFMNFNPNQIQTYSGANVAGIFCNCYSLRTIPEDFLRQICNPVSTSYIYKVSYNFTNLYALDEVRGLNPNTGTVAITSNMFSSTFRYFNRAKEIIFATQDNGTPYTVKWKAQTIDLSKDVGFASTGGSNITSYNSGITSDKWVVNDEQYAALKNDPDWYTTGASGYYSRYNHDSAVNTINSLPDTSAYLATAGGTNTIKFKGAAGANTDGGAINTLTEEEIAVATAKGWTVTLV